MSNLKPSSRQTQWFKKGTSLNNFSCNSPEDFLEALFTKEIFPHDGLVVSRRVIFTFDRTFYLRRVFFFFRGLNF